MRDKIAFIESEYTRLERDLKSLHDDCINKIQNVINVLQNLNKNGGGFYAEQITPKINDLIEDLDGIKVDADTVFTSNEDIVKSFRITVENYDTLG